MKSEFISLIAHNWDAEYVGHLAARPFVNGAVRVHATNIAQAPLHATKNTEWQVTKGLPNFGVAVGMNGPNPIPHPDVVNLANPFYIGFGNPDADILFVGKEKGFNMVNKPVPNQPHRDYIDKTFHESILNYFHWKEIVGTHHNISAYNIPNNYAPAFARVSQYDFCPLFPPADHHYQVKYPQNIIPGHTWPCCQVVFNAATGVTAGFNQNNMLYQDSIFSKCFMTEISHISSRNAPGMDFSTRLRFLNQDPHAAAQFSLYSDFVKTFKIIVAGAKSYINNPNNPIDVNKLFGFAPGTLFATKRFRPDLGYNDIYVDGDRILVVTAQISRHNAWFNFNHNGVMVDPLNNLGRLLHKFLNDRGNFNVAGLQGGPSPILYP